MLLVDCAINAICYPSTSRALRGVFLLAGVSNWAEENLVKEPTFFMEARAEVWHCLGAHQKCRL